MSISVYRSTCGAADPAGNGPRCASAVGRYRKERAIFVAAGFLIRLNSLRLEFFLRRRGPAPGLRQP
jgi:hypothetical protein